MFSTIFSFATSTWNLSFSPSGLGPPNKVIILLAVWYFFLPPIQQPSRYLNPVLISPRLVLYNRWSYQAAMPFITSSLPRLVMIIILLSLAQHESQGG